jgi:hypothetical protein
MAKRAPARNFPPLLFLGGIPDDRPAIPAPAKGRLGNGQLRRQVADWLAARPARTRSARSPKTSAGRPARSATP